MRRHRIAAFAMITLVTLSGCGDGDDATSPEAQPAPDVTRFVEGDFGDIPVPPRAEPAGERSERDDVTARSYFVRNMTPEAVMDFYTDYFSSEGDTAIRSPEPTGPDAWRGTWLVDGRELLVSTILAPTAGGAEVENADVVTQLDLELSPGDGGGHEGGTAEGGG